MHETSRPITRKEFETIISHCREKSKIYKNRKRKYVCLRNTCLFSLMWFIGCRPKEAYAALISDIDLETGNFLITSDRNKTRKTRSRKIPETLKYILIEYLKLNRALFPETKYIFPSTNPNSCVRKRGLQKQFQKILRDLGMLRINFIDKKNVPRYTINLYSFRKGHGTYLYEKTGDPYLVQKSLDHLHIETTCKFYIRAIPEILNNKILNIFNF